MPYRKNPVPRINKSLINKDEASINALEQELLASVHEHVVHHSGSTPGETIPENKQHSRPKKFRQRTTRYRIHHRRRPQAWKTRIRKFFGIKSKNRAGNKNKVLPSFNDLLARVKKLAGFPEKAKKLPKELFLKTDENGAYRIVKARVVTTIGMEEENLPDSHLPVSPGNKHKKGLKQKLSLKRISRYLFFWRKKQPSPHHRHSGIRHKSGETATTALNQETPLPAVRKRKRSLSFLNINPAQLVKSWLSWGYLLKLLSSTGLFMVAYIVVWFLYSLATIFVASFYDINAVLYYYEVMWPAGNAIPPWSDFIAIIVTLSGPLVSVTIAGLCFLFLTYSNWAGSQVRTFGFWLFVNSLLHFFGAFAAGVITWEGFGYVMDWIHLHTFFLFLFSVLFLSVLVFIGWYYARFILEVRPLSKHGSSIPMILINRMVLPYLLGTLILVALKIPGSIPQHPYIYDYDVLILASGLFMVVPPIFNTRLKPLHRTYKNSTVKQQYIKAGMVIFLSACLVLLYRIGLSDGLYIFMKFIVDVIPY